MGNAGGNSKDQNADGYMDGKSQTRETLAGDKVSTGNRIKDHVCYTTAENLSTSCPYSKTLQETEIKASGLTNLVKKTSRQSNIWAVACVLLIMFKQIYSEKQGEQKNLRNLNFGPERTMRKVGSKVAEKISSIKKKVSTFLDCE